MLDTLPYADLLAIYNAITEKPVMMFDTRANGVRRTEALLDARGVTLPEAAGLADVVLPEANSFREDAATTETAARGALPGDDADPNQPDADAGHEGDTMGDPPGATIRIEASVAPFVNAFVRELMKRERPAYVTAFLRRLDIGGAPAGNTKTKREGGMTPSQRMIVELCSRPEGATGKEVAEGCGWPSIAARTTCQKLADRFGYDLHESPKANGRGISFRLTAKPAAEGQA
jgi:hypothetical protein